MTTISEPEGIYYFQLLATRGALTLEILGIRAAANYSAYAVIKKRFGFKGNRQKVLDQFNEYIEQWREEHKEQLKQQITP